MRNRACEEISGLCRVLLHACEEPPPRRVKEIPIETWDKPPYPHGTQAAYKCRPGYIKVGRIVFECTDGAWEQPFQLLECRPKPCGHPGDIQFGSFELTAGDQFVFGARVEYRCDEGYQMLNLKNYRECQADGWSNSVPHCEETTCDRPEIQDGYVESTKASYKKSERLRFSCNKGYRHGDKAEVECTDLGWSPTPYCTEVLCPPPRIPNGIFNPRANVYREGSEITVECNSGYHFKAVTGQNTAQCTKAGWAPSPECVAKPCDYPVIENGELSEAVQRNAHIYFPMAIGQQVDYHCHDGYSTPRGDIWVRIRCYASGWRPEPECMSKYISTLENGAFLTRNKYVYKEGETTKYSCSADYTPEKERGQVTCTKNDWSPPPRCIRKSE
uniref:Sushi domain-containing protein n=1 Tax=Nothoprocta perdicaria TaxID=30464 RepID=A0A8C6Z1I9_NOTPE